MIDPKKETVRILLNSSQLLRVPEYQRSYEWGNNEVGEFWEDLISYKDSTSQDNFFLGTLIFNVGQNQNEILIVDGQQRITTIFLFLIAAKIRLQLIGEKQALLVTARIQGLITSVSDSTGETIGVRLHASNSIKDVFDKISDASWDGINFPERNGRKSLKQQVRKVKPIYEFFFKNLQQFDLPQISQILETLYSAYFVRIDITSDDEAFKIFERNNARGVDLEASDLLKNYFFQTMGSSVSENWDRIISNADKSFPRMLKYFYVSHKGYIKKSDLYRKLKSEFSSKNLLDDLHYYSTFYQAIRNTEKRELFTNYLESTNSENSLSIIKDQDKLEKIFLSLDGLSLFKITQIYPLIFSAIHSFNKTPIPEGNSGYSKLLNQFVLFFENLERYHFINNAICARIGNEVEHLYADSSKKFYESSDFIASSKEFFNELNTKLAFEDEFISRFIELNYEQNNAVPVLMYIFDRFYNYDFNRNQTVSSSELSRLKIFNPTESFSRRSVNVDHWYPQNTPHNNHINKEDIHNIGNLIVISFKANSSLNNDLPEVKIQKFKNGLSGEIQNSNYVKNFISEYESDSANWNTEIIKKRALDLSKQAYQKIWKFKTN
jgi:hypothetical protein